MIILEQLILQRKCVLISCQPLSFEINRKLDGGREVAKQWRRDSNSVQDAGQRPNLEERIFPLADHVTRMPLLALSDV